MKKLKMARWVIVTILLLSMGYQITSSSSAEQKHNFYGTKLSGLVVSLGEDRFLLDSGFGKFSIRLKKELFQAMIGDDVTVIGRTNELYAKEAVLFADKIFLHSRKSRTETSITRNIQNGWITINGRVSSIKEDRIALYGNKKIIVYLKDVEFIPPLQAGSLVSVNGNLLDEKADAISVKAKNIIKISK